MNIYTSPNTQIQARTLLFNHTRLFMNPCCLLTSQLSVVLIQTLSQISVYCVPPLLPVSVEFFLAFARLDRGVLSFVLAQQFHGFATRQSSCIFQMQKTRKTTPLSFGRVPTTLLGILASRLGIPLGVLAQGRIMLKKANSQGTNCLL